MEDDVEDADVEEDEDDNAEAEAEHKKVEDDNVEEGGRC